VGSGTTWESADTWTVEVEPGTLIVAVKVWDDVTYLYSAMGLIARVDLLADPSIFTGSSWRVSETGPEEWEQPSFNDSDCASPLAEGPFNSVPWITYAPPIAAFEGTNARWIWRGSPPYAPGYGYYNDGNWTFCYFRRSFEV